MVIKFVMRGELSCMVGLERYFMLIFQEKKYQQKCLTKRFIRNILVVLGSDLS